MTGSVHSAAKFFGVTVTEWLRPYPDLLGWDDQPVRGIHRRGKFRANRNSICGEFEGK